MPRTQVQMLDEVDADTIKKFLPTLVEGQSLLTKWPILQLRLSANNRILGELYRAYEDTDYGYHQSHLGESSKTDPSRIKRAYHSNKRVKKDPKVKEQEERLKKSYKKLTEGALVEALSQGCSCPNKCCERYKVWDIKALRTEFYGMKCNRKKEIVFSKIEASEQRQDGMVLFKNGLFICRKAFWQFHWISRSTYYSYKDQVINMDAKQGFHGNKDKPKTRGQMLMAMSFLRSFLESTAEPMPHLTYDNSEQDVTDDIKYKLPSCYDRKQVYNEVATAMKEAGQPMISLSTFYRKWGERFRNFELHKNSAFSKCTECIRFRTLLMKERGCLAREETQRERKVHLDRQMSGRNCYYAHNHEAVTKPSKFGSSIHDGMDNAKTTIPRMNEHIKALTSNNQALPLKLSGILHRGSGPEKMAHVTINGLWAGDPDYTVSSLAKYLRDLERYDGNILGDLTFRKEPRHVDIPKTEWCLMPSSRHVTHAGPKKRVPGERGNEGGRF